MNSTFDSTAGVREDVSLDGIAPAPCGGATWMRTSDVLRGILVKNPGVTTFSVERILASIGTDRFDASLMMFAIPGIVPVEGPPGMVAVPTGAIACQMVAGQKRIRLPQFILKQSVSRRSVAVAIHTILPVLEAAERIVRPRWSWLSNSIARRAIGLFIFLLAIAIAQPLLGFNALHSLSICVLSLGMAERDGLAIMLGLVAGLLSLAVLAVSGVTERVLRSKLGKLLRRLSRRLGFRMFSKFLRRLGYPRLARVVAFEWYQLFMMWDPEKPRAGSSPARAVRTPTPCRDSRVGQPASC